MTYLPKLSCGNTQYAYFIYKTGEVIYQCEAHSILEADQMLLNTKGIDAAKERGIGCREA